MERPDVWTLGRPDVQVSERPGVRTVAAGNKLKHKIYLKNDANRQRETVFRSFVRSFLFVRLRVGWRWLEKFREKMS